MPRNKKTPQTELSELEPDFVSETITSLRQLYDKGKPQTDEELENRIDEFFDFCYQHEMRPGIESLALALGVSRQTIWAWSRGEQCSPQRTEIIQRAKMLIGAFLEQSSLCGKLNPATSIFLMKNWLNYRDSIEVETAPKITTRIPLKSREELLKIDVDAPELPDFNEMEE